MLTTGVGRRVRQAGLALCVATIAAGVGVESAAAASITGTVANDFNANGVRDVPSDPKAAATDTGLAGVSVTAYGADGSPLASATSGADGTYTLGVPDNVGPVRVEFTNLPADYSPGPYGPNDGTSVQFVNVGTGTVAGVDYGAAVPEDYCGDNPLIVVCRFTFGGTTDPAPNTDPATVPAVLGFRASPGTDDIADPGPGGVTLATQAQVGAVYGEAIDKATGDVYVSAFMKAHTFYGPSGPGGVYRIPADASSPTGYGAPIPFATVPNAGGDPHTTTDAFNDGFQATYTTPGTIGLGDLELGPDGKTLWTIDLATKELVPIAVGSGALGAGVAIPSPCATGADWRPQGLGVHRGSLYVGGVCTVLGSTNAADQLVAVVDSYTPTAGFRTVLTTPQLSSIPRKCADRANNTSASDPTNVCDDPTVAAWSAQWNQWTNEVTLPNTLAGSGPAGGGRLTVVAHPEPEVGSITFDGSDLVLGLRDRWGDQLGFRSPGPDPTDVDPANSPDRHLYNGLGAGDDYLACPAGDGTYTLESNASCGGRTATAGQGNGEGPGGGEFFHSDDAVPHDQTSMGASALVPGFQDLLATAVDPIFSTDAAQLNAGGVVWNDVASSDPGALGARTGQLRVYRDNTNGAANSQGAFGKANGLGDLEAICTSAPLQIGNRVFSDTDRDGIQDAGEPGIAGVTVQLYQGDTLVGTTATDANGQYLFGNTGPGGVTLQPNTSYDVRIPTDQPTLAGLQASPTAAGDVRTIDSNGTVIGSLDVGPVTTGAAGENDHTIDFGFFTPRYDLALRKTTPDTLVTVGDLVPFNIEVFNQGPDAGAVTQNITVTDEVPTGFSFFAADNPGWDTTGVGREVATTIPGPLAPGASTVVTINLRVAAGATGTNLTNVAEISAFQDLQGNQPPDIDSTPDTDLHNDTTVDDVIDNAGGDEDDNDIATVYLRPGSTPPGKQPRRTTLAIGKAFVSKRAVGGSVVAWRVTVRNTGRVTARSVIVCDALPPKATFVSASVRSFLKAGRPCFKLGDLKAGRSRSFLVRTRLTSDVKGKLTNKVTVNGSNTGTKVARRTVAARPKPARGGGVTG